MSNSETEEDTVPLRRQLSDPITRARNETKGWVDKARLKVRDYWHGLKPHLPSTSAYISGFLGWAFVSFGLYLVIGHPAVLYISTGLLCLGGLGWRTVAELVWDGIYVKWLRDQQHEETQG